MDEGLRQNEYSASVLLVILRRYIVIYPYGIFEISPWLILLTVVFVTSLHPHPHGTVDLDVAG